jgi:hypothetical protein
VTAAVEDGGVLAMLSPTVFAKCSALLTRPRLRLKAAGVDAALTTMRMVATVVRAESPPPPAGLPDDKDWTFIACAVAAGCPVITGNARDFPAALGVRVMTAREWVQARR